MKYIHISISRNFYLFFSDVSPPAAEDSSISSSRQLSRKNSQRDNLSVLSGSNSKQQLPDPCKSENQSLLGAIGPLDWLFSDSDEPEPPSSPKCVTKSKQQQTAAAAEQEGLGGAQ